MNRKQQRDIVFKLLYQADTQKETPSEILDIYYGICNDEERVITDKDKEYIENVFFGVYENIEKIDDIISKKAKEWNFNRISKLVISALRLAVYEMLFIEDIPSQVSVNEAVNIVKLYCGEESTGFVNGILATLV